MKKSLLLIAMASLMVLGAGAQEKVSERVSSLRSKSLTRIQPEILTREMKVDAPAITVTPPKRSTGPLDIYYRRPAGAFYAACNAHDGEGLYAFGDVGIVLMKPFSGYTYYGTVNGADGDDILFWDGLECGNGGEPFSAVEYYEEGTYEFPVFSVWQNGDPYQDYSFRYPYVSPNPYDGVIYNNESGAVIVSASNFGSYWGDEKIELLLSSKTMCSGGVNGDQVGMLSRYYGAKPWGENEYGWWFGKNASHVDGMAQCFEKPQHPYLLKNVYLQCANNYEENIGMVVNNPVKLYCKVYKLSEIPDYQEVGGARLPLDPGELIVTGEATITPTTGEALNGLVTFVLKAKYPMTGLTYEYHPTIDYPIMIAIEGYNDPGMEDLVEFSAFVSVDDQVDEGYGELCYLKTGIYEYEIDEQGDTVKDEEGNPVRFFTGEYQWRGLNNYFSNGTLTLKTGLSIFISTENPFITFVHGLEDGEYHFPDEGGLATKTFEYSDGSVYTTESIDFLSSVPGEDGDMWMTCNGSDELPDWLEINLVDTYDEEGNFTNNVTAQVTAEALPADVQYRKATIRFEIPGDYIEYKFTQGVEPPHPQGDVDGNGEVNIADVNCLIKVILGQVDADIYEGRALVNDDDEVNIADVNAVIAIILKG